MYYMYIVHSTMYEMCTNQNTPQESAEERRSQKTKRSQSRKIDSLYINTVIDREYLCSLQCVSLPLRLSDLELRCVLRVRVRVNPTCQCVRTRTCGHSIRRFNTPAQHTHCARSLQTSQTATHAHPPQPPKGSTAARLA